MKLKQLIDSLQNILKSVDNPETVEVKMSDSAPIVNPILKEDTVFITDVEK